VIVWTPVSYNTPQNRINLLDRRTDRVDRSSSRFLSSQIEGTSISASPSAPPFFPGTGSPPLLSGMALFLLFFPLLSLARFWFVSLLHFIFFIFLYFYILFLFLFLLFLLFFIIFIIFIILFYFILFYFYKLFHLGHACYFVPPKKYPKTGIKNIYG